MEIKPIKKVTLTEQIMQQIASQIISGQLKPGEKLPTERAFAEMFEVNRGRIREALRALSLIGLVNIKPGEGSFVSSNKDRISEESVLWTYHEDVHNYEEIYAARQLIETEVYLTCYKNRTEEIIEALDTFSTKLFAIDIEEISTSDFYDIISDIDSYVGSHCGNSIYDKLMQTLILLRKESALKISGPVSSKQTAIFYRKKEYNFDKCIYVTGLEQKLHFAQVFKVVELMGYEWAKENLIHVPYGLVSLEGGKLSTRSGNIVYAEDILKESVSKIREIIAEKNPDLKDKEDVAQKVGIGAIIFNDLYNQRIKDVTFTWEKIHSFDGETGPYVQYTYARAASVLRKTGITEVGEIDPSLVTDETSVALLKEIERFPEVIKVAADRLEPSVISRYVMGVAQSFNRFYHENQCNVEDQKLKEARVKIVILAKQVIKDGLDLLGIQCPEQM